MLNLILGATDFKIMTVEMTVLLRKNVQRGLL